LPVARKVQQEALAALNEDRLELNRKLAKIVGLGQPERMAA
jgi:hypothetical protein